MLGHGRLGGLPEVSDVFHVDVEVEVAADELRVARLVLLVGEQGPQLRNEGRGNEWSLMLNVGLD